MKLINQALNDTLFIRTVFFIFGMPFYLAFIWIGVEQRFFLDSPSMLIITGGIGAASLYFIYLAFIARHKTPFSSEAIDGSFWIAFIIIVTALLPLWLIIRPFRFEEDEH